MSFNQQVTYYIDNRHPFGLRLTNWIVELQLFKFYTNYRICTRLKICLYSLDTRLCHLARIQRISCSPWYSRPSVLATHCTSLVPARALWPHSPSVRSQLLQNEQITLYVFLQKPWSIHNGGFYFFSVFIPSTGQCIINYFQVLKLFNDSLYKTHMYKLMRSTDKAYWEMYKKNSNTVISS